MKLIDDMNWKSFARSEYIGSCDAGGHLMQLFYKDDKWYALIGSSIVYELNAHDVHTYRKHIDGLKKADDMASAMKICQRKAAEHKDIAGFYMQAYTEFEKRYEKLMEVENEGKKAH